MRENFVMGGERDTFHTIHTNANRYFHPASKYQSAVTGKYASLTLVLLPLLTCPQRKHPRSTTDEHTNHVTFQELLLTE